MSRKKQKKTTRRQRGKRTFYLRFLLFVLKIAASLMLVSILLVLVLRWIPPLTTSFILQDYYEHRNKAQYRNTGTVVWTDWDEISPFILGAIIVAEDQRFLHHKGFDVVELQNAWTEFQDGKRLRGASTLTQQLAKNLFLWSGRSIFRKGLEAYFTILIEMLWSKQRILEVYVNVVQFGSGVYGVTSASPLYFHKSPAQVTLKEAALMAAVLPNPLRFRIDKPSAYIRQRQDWIINQFKLNGGVNMLAEQT